MLNGSYLVLTDFGVVTTSESSEDHSFSSSFYMSPSMFSAHYIPSSLAKHKCSQRISKDLSTYLLTNVLLIRSGLSGYSCQLNLLP